MSQLGRIGGGVLAANLERQGINLSFKNQANSTPVLFFDVTTKQIGFNTDILTPGRDFSISTKLRTVDFKNDIFDTPSYNIQNNRIEVDSGNILLNAVEKIQASRLATDDLRIQDNAIFSNDENTDIEIRSVKDVDIYSDFIINGNLFSSGNIVLQSDFIFGNEIEDTVIFDAKIESSLIPKENNTRSIGSNELQWNNFYVDFFNGEAFQTSSITIGDFDNIVLEQGNVLYVAVNGSDTNKGEHQQDPLRTIRRALEIVDASTQAPTTIYVFPGVYNEITPLIVPENVTIKGTDIRNTIITPDSTSDSEDVFLLNDRTTIEDITIKGFFYNSIDNTGHAFRFAPGAVLATRSPYIRNVSVITQGSNITLEDPRGFDSGDAGRGAYIDRTDLDSSSADASVLFHTVTFITPGVDAVTLTNDVRVEFINTFTYFANRGFYAINGAEVRSINSANVYGNFGIVADGTDSLFYLIGHNFAYVGLGKRTDNDTTLKIETNEAVKLNGGRIFYNSIDEVGKFKVGDTFFVNQETGETNLTGDDVFFDNLSSLTLTKNSSTTVIDFSKINVGNFSFAGNTIFSLTGDNNILSASDKINFTRNQSSDITDVTINKNLQLNNDLIANDVIFNNIVTFNSQVISDIIPNQNLTYDLGSNLNVWRSIYLTEIDVNDFLIDNNTISITELNEDLILAANGTGRIKIEDIFFKNNVISSNNSIDIVDDVIFNENYVSSFTDVTISKNLQLNTDLNANDVIFNNDVTFNSQIISDIIPNQNLTYDLGSNLNVWRSIYLTEIDVNDFLIDNNTISITELNEDLILAANGTGRIKIEDIFFKNNVISTVLQTIDFKTDNLLITSNKAIKVQNGNTLQRDFTEAGIRLNTDDFVFEGFSDNAVIGFGGVYSDDRRTSLIVNKYNNTILYKADNIAMGNVNLDRLFSIKTNVDSITIDANQIFINNGISDLLLTPDGTGAFLINEVEYFENSNIFNKVQDGSLTLVNTGEGYTKFSGTFGLAIPNSDEINKDTNPEIGETIFNTDTEIVEVWNGTAWIPSTGVAASVTDEEFEDITSEWSLILG
jgi:hypothetical protein